LDRQRGRDQTTKTTSYSDGTQTSATSTVMSYDGMSPNVASQTTTTGGAGGTGGTTAPPVRYTLDPAGTPVSATWQNTNGTTSTDHCASIAAAVATQGPVTANLCPSLVLTQMPHRHVAADR